MEGVNARVLEASVVNETVTGASHRKSDFTGKTYNGCLNDEILHLGHIASPLFRAVYQPFT
jgi:hypothetical protein